MTDENSYLVDYRDRATSGPNARSIPPTASGPSPSVEQAAALMRQVYEDREGAARIGGRAAADVERALSPLATGTAMRNRLEELAQLPTDSRATTAGAAGSD